MVYLEHAAITGLEEAGGDGEKSKQGMVSQPDLPRHLQGCYTSDCPTHKEVWVSGTCTGHSGAESMQEIHSRCLGTLPCGQTSLRSP